MKAKATQSTSSITSTGGESARVPTLGTQLKKQLCGCFQRQDNTNATHLINGHSKHQNPNPSYQPLDHSTTRSGQLWGTLQFIRDLDPALSDVSSGRRRIICAQYDCRLQRNLESFFRMPHGHFPDGIYSKIEVKPFSDYKPVEHEPYFVPFHPQVKFGLWKDDNDFEKICCRASHSACLSPNRTASTCLQSYKRRLIRRRLPFTPFKCSKFDFQIVVVDVLPPAKRNGQASVEVEVVNTGSHPIFVQLALHEHRLQLEKELLHGSTSSDSRDYPTVYKRVDAGGSKRLFQDFDELAQEFYEQLTHLDHLATVNIVPGWCNASTFQPFNSSDLYYTYNTPKMRDSDLVEFFSVTLIRYKKYFSKLKYGNRDRWPRLMTLSVSYK